MPGSHTLQECGHVRIDATDRFRPRSHRRRGVTRRVRLLEPFDDIRAPSIIADLAAYGGQEKVRRKRRIPDSVARQATGALGRALIRRIPVTQDTIQIGQQHMSSALAGCAHTNSRTPPSRVVKRCARSGTMRGMAPSAWFFAFLAAGTVAMWWSVRYARSWPIPVLVGLTLGTVMVHNLIGRQLAAQIGPILAGAALGMVAGVLIERLFGFDASFAKAMKRNAPADAESIARSMVKARADVDAYAALGLALYTQERWQEALAAFAQADDRARREAQSESDNDEALADVFDDTHKLAPRGAALRANHALALWRCGDAQTALRMIKSAATALPDEPILQLSCAEIAIDAGDRDEARKRLERGKALAESRTNAHDVDPLRSQAERCEQALREHIE